MKWFKISSGWVKRGGAISKNNSVKFSLFQAPWREEEGVGYVLSVVNSLVHVSRCISIFRYPLFSLVLRESSRSTT